jgi:hypothetical protein
VLFLLAPFAVIPLAVWLVLVRLAELTDPQEDGVPDQEHVDEVRRFEDWYVQNPFTAVGEVKAGVVRRVTMRVALAGLGFACRHSFAHDNLAGVTSIHFARWVPLDDGERLIFASSYDGSLESYMDDFISRLAWGINLVFSNGVGFPKARWLVLGGARTRSGTSTTCDATRCRPRSSTPPTPSSPRRCSTGSGPSAAASTRATRRVPRAGWRSCDPVCGTGGQVNDQLVLDDIQGLVARGYGRLPHAAYVLLRIDEPGPARNLIDGLLEVGSVTTASQSAPHRAMNVAFTAPGIRRLTESTALPEGFSEPFLTGMVTDYRSRLLGDVGANVPTAWEWGGPTTDAVHVVLLLFAPDQGAVDAWHDSLVADVEAHGFHVVRSLTTAKLSNREPFGFRDGISQPILAGLGGKGREGDVLKNGEFVLGYVNEYGQRTERPLLTADADPHGILPRDPDGSGMADLGRNGSYLVFRQLGQDLTGFEAYLDRAATVGDRVDPQARDWLAAKLVGRWRGSGAPLTLAPEHDDPTYEAANDFGFHALDQEGMRCPVGAHIRRANPATRCHPTLVRRRLAR